MNKNWILVAAAVFLALTVDARILNVLASYATIQVAINISINGLY